MNFVVGNLLNVGKTWVEQVIYLLEGKYLCSVLDKVCRNFVFKEVKT